jgi:hypothetical protein
MLFQLVAGEVGLADIHCPKYRGTQRKSWRILRGNNYKVLATEIPLLIRSLYSKPVAKKSARIFSV